MVGFYIFLGLALVGMAGFFYTYFQSKTFKESAKKVKASVIKVERQVSYDRENNTETVSYYPVFRLRYNNKNYQQRSNVGQNPPRYKQGDQPVVWFHLGPTGDYRIKETGWFSLNFGWVLCLAATAIMLFFAYYFYT